MNLGKLLEDNTVLVKSSLNLIEATVKTPDAKTRLIEDALSAQESSEVVKGLLIALKALFHGMKEDYSLAAIHESLRSEIEESVRKSQDVSIDSTALSLLEAVEENGGSFYLQINSIQEPVKVTAALIDLFERFCYVYYQDSPRKDALKAIPPLRSTLNYYIEEGELREEEEAELIEAMRKNRDAVEEALQLTELLECRFSVDTTEDGKKIPYLSEETLNTDDIMKAVEPVNQVELLKGLCLVTGLSLSMFLCKAGMPLSSVLYVRRQELASDPEDENIQLQHLGLNLLESLAAKDEQGFYQQAYAIDDLSAVIVSLNTSLYATTRYVAHEDTLTLVKVLRELLK